MLLRSIANHDKVAMSAGKVTDEIASALGDLLSVAIVRRIGVPQIKVCEQRSQKTHTVGSKGQSCTFQAIS